MKKHMNRFSVVFNTIDKQQLFAVEKLNSLPPRSLALYISQAIYAYEHEANSASKLSTEKRGRGRPKKTQSVILSDASSSSHITKKHSEEAAKLSNDDSVQVHASEESSDKPEVNAAMLGSMMSFLDGT